MAITKYENQEKNSERVSTNGYYTGHHKGSVTQDASSGADNAAYYVERNTVRFGTITQDALPDSMPTVDSDQDSDGGV